MMPRNYERSALWTSRSNSQMLQYAYIGPGLKIEWLVLRETNTLPGLEDKCLIPKSIEAQSKGVKGCPTSKDDGIIPHDETLAQASSTIVP